MKKKGLSSRERKRLVLETQRGAGVPDDATRREELLRPSPGLGYDRVQIALHLIEREAYSIAEAELRRAIWLNPYDSSFKLHLAFCLYRQKRFEEARELLLSVEAPEHREDRDNLLKLVSEKLERRE